MLPSNFRLKLSPDFLKIEKEGRLIQSKSFGLGFFDRKDQNFSRFGIVVSTKISKKAIVRNKIKRIIMRVLAKNIKNLPKGYNVVFLLKPSVLPLDREKLENEVNEIVFKKL